MGIINVTPDSFFSGSRKQSQQDILKQAETMLQEGATFLDVGGYSSRPGANDVSEKEEIQRVIPAIESIVKHFPEAFISADTFRYEVAKHALEAGARIINDISGGADERMIRLAAAYHIPYILMHMQGTPQTMQQNPKYENILTEIFDFYAQRITEMCETGVHDIILDPGFGFGKTLEHNYHIAAHLDYFSQLNCPVLAGVSRKSMLTKLLGIESENALNATTALHMSLLEKGAKILRVHDVKEAVECVRVFLNLNRGLE